MEQQAILLQSNAFGTACNSSFILTLIIIIASFNIIGSLTMLIIEKERDIEILKSLGADNNLIRKIFIFEGWLISIIGAFAGLILGFIICWLQERFGLIRFTVNH